MIPRVIQVHRLQITNGGFPRRRLFEGKAEDHLHWGAMHKREGGRVGKGATMATFSLDLLLLFN